MPKQKRKKPASDEEGEEVEIIPLPPYRNEGKKISWKKMAVALKTIFDYEGDIIEIRHKLVSNMI